MTKIVGISGSLSTPSRTRNLVENILIKASQRSHWKSEIIDIAGFAKELGSTISFNELPDVLTEAFKKLSEADLIIIGTPVYKASYTGLLKHFFDLLDPKQLNGKIAILAATGGSDQHALVLDYQLRPLTSFFGITAVTTGIYAKDSEFIDYQLQSEAIEKRIETAVEQALQLLPKNPSVELAA